MSSKLKANRSTVYKGSPLGAANLKGLESTALSPNHQFSQRI